MKKVRYLELEGKSASFNFLAALFAGMAALGAWAFFHLEHSGHADTGMNNQIVWGLPHVFAIMLIVAASGALNLASIGTVFNKGLYKPLARISAWLSISLLMGGVIVLVLDLGNPFHIDYMFTSFNETSIFAWNILLYPGFFLFTGIYLWTMMDTSKRNYYKSAGTAAFIWRLILTSGTGLIFGLLVGRIGFNAAIMAPMFIVVSFSVGLAFFIITLMATYKWSNRPLGCVLLKRLKNLLVIFIAAAFYFAVIFHLTKYYSMASQDLESWLLFGDSVHTKLLWIGQVVIGTLIPLALLLIPRVGECNTAIFSAAVLVIIGTFCQFFVTIIGTQAFPQQVIGSDYQVIASKFGDADPYHVYSPSSWEVMLGLGGLGLTFLMVLYGFKIMRFLPESLADKDLDPHAKSA